MGSGSVIDCCKIVSAQAMLNEDIWGMEFTKKQYPSKFIPMGCVVTASGTGREMNSSAVITNDEKKLKAGVLGAYNSFAMLDPGYTITISFKQVMSGAFNTLSHAMETYFGKPHDHNNRLLYRDTIPFLHQATNLAILIKKTRDRGSAFSRGGNYGDHRTLS